VEGTTHYIGFIDTLALLRHATIGPSLMDRLLHRLIAHDGVPEVVLFAQRRRARTFAQGLLAGFCRGDLKSPPVLIGVDNSGGRFVIPPRERERIAGRRVLVADAAAGHGDTLDHLGRSVLELGAQRVSATVLLSRMSDGQEAALSARLSGTFIRLFQFPLRPLSVKDKNLCPICKQRAIARHIATTAKSELVRGAANARLGTPRRPSSSAPPMKRPIQLTLRELNLERPFIATCGRSVASGVTLHALCAAQNDGMAPLHVPELMDMTIAPARRASMIKDLPEAVVTDDHLVTRMTQALEMIDDNDTWNACIELMSRGKKYQWLDVLQKRCESNGFLETRSPAFWKTVAYWTYVGASNSESLRQDAFSCFASLAREAIDPKAAAIAQELRNVCAQTLE
jgi:hypothetical protein